MRANEEQRNDPELQAAVLAILVVHRENLKKAISHMRIAYKILSTPDDLSRNDVSSRYDAATSHLFSDITKLQWYVAHILEGIEENTANGTSATVSNKAAFLTADEAKDIKRKFGNGTY